WDVEGQVGTADAPEKSRPLYVYQVDAETIDPAALAAASPSLYYFPFQQADAIPADSLKFEIHEFGCHRGAVAVVAWSPVITPPSTTGPGPAFNPQAGDYFAFSDVRHPYCGMSTHPEHIDLVLDGREFPGR